MNYDVQMDQVRRCLVASGIARLRDIVGYCLEEIDQIEEYFDIVLPSAFRAFLLTMGHKAGIFCWYNEMMFDSWEGYLFLDDQRRWEEENHGPLGIWPDGFVFASFQGKLLYFTTLMPDPPVYAALSESRCRVQEATSFTSYL